MSWVISGSRRAVLGTLGAQERPERAQATPGAHQEPPGRPQESPRGSQRLPSSSLKALLGLSWGSLEQATCSANLSFTEAKPRVAKMEEFEYKISCEVNCQKPLSSFSKMYTTLARKLQNASARAIFPLLRHLRR